MNLNTSAIIVNFYSFLPICIYFRLLKQPFREMFLKYVFLKSRHDHLKSLVKEVNFCESFKL